MENGTSEEISSQHGSSNADFNNKREILRKLLRANSKVIHSIQLQIFDVEDNLRQGSISENFKKIINLEAKLAEFLSNQLHLETEFSRVEAVEIIKNVGEENPLPVKLCFTGEDKLEPKKENEISNSQPTAHEAHFGKDAKNFKSESLLEAHLSESEFRNIGSEKQFCITVEENLGERQKVRGLDVFWTCQSVSNDENNKKGIDSANMVDHIQNI